MNDSRELPLTSRSTPRFQRLRLDQLNWHSEQEIPLGVEIFDYEALIRNELAPTLREALTKGYPFYIRNYGLSEAEVEAAFNETRRFFNQPEEEKAKMVHPERGLIFRGYSAYGTGAYENSINDGAAVNQYVKYAWGPSDNVYPNADFARTYDNIFAKLSAVARGVLRSIGHALELTGHEQWQNLFDGEDTVLHCQCYYPEAPRGAGRMMSHADASTVTLLNQLPAENGHVGLQAKLGEYVGIPAIRDTLVVLSGESLSGITQGRARPCMHAVIGPKHDIEKSERSSMPFFANPRSAFVMPLPEDTTHGRFYNTSGITTFGDFSRNVANAYKATEQRRQEGRPVETSHPSVD